jgi:hypothetical protein
MSSFDIESPDFVEYSKPKFLISSTNFAVSSAPRISNEAVRIFLSSHFFNTSFTKPSSAGTISLNRSLP